MRGFKVAKGYENSNVNIPVRGTSRSAGYDLEVITDFTIKPGEIYLAPTGLKAYMNDNEVLMLYPRSSLAVKRYLTIPNNVGIIDADYFENPNNDGHIFVALFNFGTKDVEIKKGERVAQGIFTKYLTCEDEEVTTNTRTGGFGSTGV